MREHLQINIGLMTVRYLSLLQLLESLPPDTQLPLSQGFLL
jgi:hypothetical protein